MNTATFVCGCLLLNATAQIQAADSAPDSPQEGSSALGSLLPSQGEVRTENVEISVIAEDEFKPEVRRLPQLVEKIQTERLAADSPYVLLPHRPNYVLPVSWQSDPSDREIEQMLQNVTGDPSISDNGHHYDNLEAVFQLSIKYQLAEGMFGKLSRVEVAYTNRSFWQSYSSAISRPFRETNHEPELIFSWQTQNKWVDYFSLALNHQSNGQTSSLSRSWNRVILEGGSVFPIGVLRARVWWRMPEKSSADPLDPADDDNPHIEHYMGPGELSFLYAHGRHSVSVMARNNFDFSRNKGALEVGWSFPMTKRIKGYVHYFTGYGESLIDYNRSQQRFGIGIKLSDWL